MAAIFNALAGGGLTGVAKIIDSIRGKSPEDAAKLAQIAADTEQLQMKYAGEFSAQQTDLIKSQIAVNQVEATNDNIFVSGWRPFVGWVCGSGLAIQFIIAPVSSWIAALLDHPIAFPTLDLGTLLTLLFGLLGLGGLRTVEKIRGINAGN